MAKLIDMKNVFKAFFGVTVLDDVSFEIDGGEVAAICGENGAGKSTLMKILAAIYKAESGTVLVEGKPIPKNATTLDMQRLGISMIHQELNLMDHLTVAQNIFLTREPKNRFGLINFSRMNKDATRLLESLGQFDVKPTDMVGDLKIAQKQMVEIAKAISFNVKALIMDEPTSMLTTKETEILFDLIRKLKAQGIGIIYISHRLKEIKEICDKVTVLRDGGFVVTRDVSEVTEQDIANYMVGREVGTSLAGDYGGKGGDVVIKVSHVSDSLLKDVSFEVRRGEIVGFSGLVGAGRSELMEYIFGVRRVESGEIFINGNPVKIKCPVDAIKNGIGFATEDRQRTGVVVGRDVNENINLIDQIKSGGFVNHKKRQTENTDRMIKRLNIKCQSKTQLVSNLSGGNQQKIVLGKWLLVDSDILILDEPTRGIDVGAREEIYGIIRGLAESGKTMIIVSSDLTEVLSICQRVIVMHEGVIKAELTHEDRDEETIMSFATNVS
jgi:ribose transport system ATP-binding protein